MRTIRVLTVSSLLLAYSAISQAAHAQSGFADLNFESANLSPIPANQVLYYVPISSALPGWTAYLGATLDTQILQNDYTLGAASVDIFGPGNNSGGIGSINGIIDGSYSVMLQAGGAPTGLGGASIAQDGLIPSNAHSIEFKAWNSEQTGMLTVSFEGSSLTPIAIGSGPNYTLYGADVSAYAGQTGNLEFTSVFNPNGASWIELDDITFSTQSVPEPSTVELGGVAAALFGLRMWRKRQGVVA